MSSAQPLKFAPAGNKQTESREEVERTPTAIKHTGRTNSATTGKVADISSPHELTAFVSCPGLKFSRKVNAFVGGNAARTAGQQV